MEQLNLLSSLEKHYDLLSEYNCERKILNDTFSNDELNISITKLERSIDILKNKNQDSKEKLDQTEKVLKEHDFTTKDIENRLYSGNIKDLKQLEVLSNEKNEMKNNIDDIESKFLNRMEEIDSDEEKLLDMDLKLKDIIEQKLEKQLKYTKIDKELSIKISGEKEEIKTIEMKIDRKLLEKYHDIKKNKKTALAYMEDGVCKACNMKASKIMEEKVKANVFILYCESCGRILYK